MTVKKYFLAIVIPPPLFEKIEAVKQHLFDEYELRGSLRSPAHITLHRPFEWTEKNEKRMIEKLNNFKFEKNFKVEINNFSFFEPRVIYVDVVMNKMLSELYTGIKNFARTELKLLNEVNNPRGFHPHITVASRDLKQARFFELKPFFETKQLNGSFICNSFALLKLEKKWEIAKEFTLGL